MSDARYWEGRWDAEADLKDAAIEAISQIKRGRFEDAILTIERNFFPTWEDVADCDSRYLEVMGRTA
jgi:hypothetical protein